MLRRRGVSLLLESLVGIGLFGVAVLLSMSIFPTGQRAVVQGKNYALANGIAREIMEECKASSFASVVDDNFFITRMTEVNGAAANVTFTVNIDETTTGVPPSEQMDVVVQVSWQESAIQRKVQLETLLFR